MAESGSAGGSGKLGCDIVGDPMFKNVVQDVGYSLRKRKDRDIKVVDGVTSAASESLMTTTTSHVDVCSAIASIRHARSTCVTRLISPQYIVLDFLLISGVLRSWLLSLRGSLSVS